MCASQYVVLASVELADTDLFRCCVASLTRTGDCTVHGMDSQAEGLLETQLRYGLDIPVRLDPRLSGLVESWAGGCEWPQLVASTSLDQGDLTRVFRRLMEVLRGMSLLPDVPKTLRQRARAAVDLLDRTPVTDDAYLTMRPTAQEGEELLAE